MCYIVQRKDCCYVVAYDGIEPQSRRERRRWVPVGADRGEAEAVVARLSADRVEPLPAKGGPITFGEFLTDTWLPRKRRQVRATTGYRYGWTVDRYVVPTIGQIPFADCGPTTSTRSTTLWPKPAARAGRGWRPKTIHEVHLIVRAALDLAVKRRLIAGNLAQHSLARRRSSAGAARARGMPRSCGLSWPRR
jgi:hypothetical protein